MLGRDYFAGRHPRALVLEYNTSAGVYHQLMRQSIPSLPSPMLPAAELCHENGSERYDTVAVVVLGIIVN